MSHAERQHARYSASSSDRWLSCTGSPRLIASLPTQLGSNKYADRGTALHMVAEAMLVHNREFKAGETISVRQDFIYELTEEDLAGTQVYVDEILDEALGADLVLVEEELDLSAIHPKVGGNVDAAVVKGDRLRVFDLKSGRGHVIWPEENPQEMQYGVGALLILPYKLRQRITEVILTIIQPFNHSAPPIRDWSTTPLRLIEHIVAIQNAVEEAERGGQLTPGEWCEWCPAATVCPALHKIRSELEMVMEHPPVAMSAEEMGQLLWKWKHLEPLMEGLLEQAQQLAESGVTIPGWKLAPKRARYAWSDETIAEVVMAQFGMDPYTHKLASPAQAKKAVGKKVYKAELASMVDNVSQGFNLVLDDLHGRAKGPTLTPALPSLADLTSPRMERPSAPRVRLAGPGRSRRVDAV